MRIYITLNEGNEKDKKILDFLDTTYSSKDYIKQMLWERANNQNATLGVQYVPTEEVEIKEDIPQEEQNATVEEQIVDEDVMKYF